MPRNVEPPRLDEHGEETHPAYGTATITSVSGWSNLFGSDARHQNFVSVKVGTATRKRDLSNDWIHSDKRIVEFHMTEAQWARFIASRGSGDGTPCTLSFIRGEGIIPEIPDPPKTSAIAADSQRAAWPPQANDEV